MSNTVSNIPRPTNEPVLAYAPGAPERERLVSEMARLGADTLEIPLVIGGERVETGDMGQCIEPHNHQHVLARYSKAGETHVNQAIEAALAAKPAWEDLSPVARASVFLKAAELLSGKYRATINAATMLNQSKNPFQAEIDSACELADFWRFNAYYAQELAKQQPDYSPQGMLNSTEYRALEGFVLALTPFNFTSIAGNLPTAPALMGNTVVWKPASTAVYAAWVLMQILEEAGLPDGVINFVPGPGVVVGPTALASEHLAGVHFTGSTAVFQGIWRTVGENIANYRSYPRIVGETGGKDFVFAHASADVDALAVALVRGAFEYQGQKCSAASRAYIPASLWPDLRRKLGELLGTVTMGPVQEMQHLVNAVIDRKAWDNAKAHIERARTDVEAEVVFGGGCDDSVGYFVEPTVILAHVPDYVTMAEELFAPILTVFVYEDEAYTQTLALCDQTSPYGLTGAIFAQDRYAVEQASEALRHAAGNFYINDKPTGAVVGQQPFGGARASGTNDKAGSMASLLRWVSMRTIKETFCPPTDYRYPFMD